VTSLGWTDAQRHDNAKAILDFYYVLALDPTQAAASWQLGDLLRQEPDGQRAAIYHFVRAATYDGPNALPPEPRKKALEYITRIWLQSFGTAEGFDRLAALTKTSVFPVGDFK